jgi:iron donor protein CyaY
MNEGEFHPLADKALEHLTDRLEEADQEGFLDVEAQNGIVTVVLNSGKQLIISKHAPSKQLWLSSPISGGLHFSYVGNGWALADGRTLHNVLAQELQALAGIAVAF